MLRIATFSYLFLNTLLFSSILIRGAQSIERRGFWINFTPFRLLKQQYSQEVEQSRISSSNNDGLMGSKPPKCETKCGNCNPCKPIRVPVQPGPHMASEYYPEAWRCKCNGKLFMP